ncbi:hypothetical protein V6N11_079273 [Hibiscus sabdariffa]|uniref:GAG-pre-integrase domain-containing protein n=1 Tax=Hibiscus sabdariffa TaxID=183260 RepID=A0ABR2RVK7_9ROSI
MATKFEIERFNRRNFSLWKLKIKAILRKDGCLVAISERPTDFTDNNKWNETDENAIADLHLALADEVLSSIEEKMTTKEIWDHLTKFYKIEPQERAELLLPSLPDSYDQLIFNMTNNILTDHLVFNDVEAAILEEENRRKNKEDRQGDMQQAEALTTLGHISEQGMKVLVEQKLLSGLTKVSLPLCEHCITSKQHRLKFNTSNSRGKTVLELVHSDVWQAPVTSLGGK